MQNRTVTTFILKGLLRRLPQALIPTLLQHQDRFCGTPLYAACTIAFRPLQIDKVNILLEAGAELKHEGGEHGTPLMGACAAGRLAAINFLASKGAKIVCERDGQIFSALRAGKHFPEVTRWLLVGRFVEGPRLLANGP